MDFAQVIISYAGGSLTYAALNVVQAHQLLPLHLAELAGRAITGITCNVYCLYCHGTGKTARHDPCRHCQGQGHLATLDWHHLIPSDHGLQQLALF